MAYFNFNERKQVPLGAGNTGKTNVFGVNYSDSEFAAKTQGALTRANWAQASTQLRPLIDRLNYTYHNPTGRAEATQLASAGALAGVQQAQQGFSRSAQSMGLALAPDQQAEVARQFSSTSNVARLDAMNRASRAYDDMKNQIALG